MIRHLARISAALCLLAPAAVQAGGTWSPLGTWQSTTGESRYQVVSCGGQGELCARLVWLRADARTAENMRYLNTYVVRNAVPASGNSWRGSVYYNGERIGGRMTMVGRNSMELTGCKLIACTTLRFSRV